MMAGRRASDKKVPPSFDFIELERRLNKTLSRLEEISQRLCEQTELDDDK